MDRPGRSRVEEGVAELTVGDAGRRRASHGFELHLGQTDELIGGELRSAFHGVLANLPANASPSVSK